MQNLTSRIASTVPFLIRYLTEVAENGSKVFRNRKCLEKEKKKIFF